MNNKDITSGGTFNATQFVGGGAGITGVTTAVSSLTTNLAPSAPTTANVYVAVGSTTATIVNGATYKVTGSVAMQVGTGQVPSAYGNLSFSISTIGPVAPLITNNLLLSYNQVLPATTQNTHFSFQGGGVFTSAQMLMGTSAGSKTYNLYVFSNTGLNVPAITPDNQGTFPVTLLIERIS